jgi:iron(III) transport system substrate-binding protein
VSEKYNQGNNVSGEFSPSRRQFAAGAMSVPLIAGAAAVGGLVQSNETAAQSSIKKSPTGDAPKPTFKPMGVPRAKVLKILSGRNRPDLTPVYRMWEQLSGMRIDLTKVSHLDAMDLLIKQKTDPQFDMMVTNTMVEPEIARPEGIFEPYKAKVATEYDSWLRAPDYSWMAISGWPRTAMVNWATMGRDPSKWPRKFTDLAEPEFKDKVVISSIQESIVTSYFTAMRIVKGDEWTTKIINRILDNGARLYKSHAQIRNAMVREGYGVALVNSSNSHVFLMEGNAVGEAWLDQEDGGLGTYVEAHSIGVVRGGKNGDAARGLIDFILSKEIQEMLARLYGEAPVNPAAQGGWVRPIRAIKRMPATGVQVSSRFKDTQRYLTALGFNMEDTEDALLSHGRSGPRRDKEPPKDI